ncbi:MAG: pyridoxamine 5'-phosphate oxidase [Gammaproteobacteria bacterium]|nr:pyridoxamine 5'-phosphate oxidase [Gammaproteobacteria bacterium]MCY4269612.1 pyridoxamine 5'-phosphate oxidase [Gammaproteobacteria bacterium]
MKLESQRREYLSGGLRRGDLARDPLDQFERWMREALELELSDPTAMAAATVDADGQPSQRIVLLKAFDEAGFVFYTNYESRKALELAGNPRISLLFPWHAINRQIKICGEAARIGREESAAYFSSRPRASQLAAAASRQSRTINSREALLAAFAGLAEKFADGEIPLPGDWGGFRVRASEYEFWQGRPDRLHDRFRYSRQSASASGGWRIERLAP